MMPEIAQLTDVEIEDIVRSEMVEDDVKRVMQGMIRAAYIILFLHLPLIFYLCLTGRIGQLLAMLKQI